ncbi:hypothetical protein NQ318_016161 [Aromia moschata]|uniref:Uncharacterized protein n=1 Tax=Aromia moschata TaxID=1265417 RepID=A0AAV8XZR6_9CUCU|nr:hypothetical protein NQ318_016161 [Aromia moschata]
MVGLKFGTHKVDISFKNVGKSLCAINAIGNTILLHYEVGQVEEHLEDVDSSQVALSSFAPSSAMVLLSTVNVLKVLESGQFPLRKWVAIDPKILDGIEKSRWSSYSIKFGDNTEGVSKTLGLILLPSPDYLSYEINISDLKSQVSKRSILSEISRIFDPLGLLSPTVIIIKIVLQELWQLKLSWDEAIPLYLHTKWVSFRAELDSLNKLRISRQVICKDYVGCIYLRSFDKFGNVFVELLCAKSKVSPVKPITIPRLELCGALVLSRLFQIVIKSLEVKFDECLFVLAWLNTDPSKLKTFVSNRVSEIQTNTQTYSWHHISTNDNPADLLSRRVVPSKLKDTLLWWNGPSWLNKDLVFVNSDSDESNRLLNMENLPDIKQTNSCLIVTQNVPLFPFQRFSCLNKLYRVIAYCLRFHFNCKNSEENRLKAIELQRDKISTSLCP